VKNILFILSSIVCIFALTISCSEVNEIKAKIDALKQEKSGTEYYNSLLELDQNNPEKGLIKYEIGSMLLASGDLEKAEPYLKKAEQLVHTLWDDAEKSDVYFALGVLSLEKKEYERAAEYADKAIGFLKEKNDPVVFIKARAYHLLGKKDDSFRIYDSMWNDKRSEMARLDMDYYFSQLQDKKNNTRALDVLNLYQEKFEYVVGQGVQASGFFEQTGMIDQAVCAAVMDLEYLYFQGSVTKKQVLERLDEIRKKLADRQFNPKDLGGSIITGLISYYNGDYASAAKTLSANAVSHHFYQYIVQASLMEAEGATVEGLKKYVEVEKYFKTLQGFYYHFWRGMKKGPGVYNYDVAKDVLEKCVLLATNSSSAAETRIEIGRLLGLDAASGAKLVLPTELEYMIKQVILGGSVKSLDRAIDMLSLPDNMYTMQSTLILRELQKKMPTVKSYLVEKRNTSAGRLKERLTMILEG